MKKDFDTIIVPCRDSKGNEERINAGNWEAVKIAAYRKPKLKYIVIYHTAPTSAITESYEVTGIETWEKDNSKYRIIFNKSSLKTHLIKYDRNNNDPILQRSRYILFENIKKAKSLKDLFN